MSKWAKILGTGCCICLLTGCVASNQEKTSTSESRIETSKQQEVAGKLDFELQGVDGKTYRLSDYQGKKVYIKFWASWCSICLASLQGTDELANEADDFVVLSVVAPEYRNEKSVEDFKQWYPTLGYEHLPVLLDEGGHIMQTFGIRAYPSSVLIDSTGKVISTHIGHVPAEDVKTKMADIQ
ncbi:redoxin family protein [Aerococcaceae bacterium NML191292]|nr:redoxin family protein [Aerococcaceae bacterium NML191292]MCW6675320.1 redoxin family protein [Aerococcaceae bacterium NML171108]MCW6677271.1 redoxin family protein [Aerococcaceae bacterium NML180378]MCW6681141.1 redoxin family protein [Aerococcaceae bacterium NML130460]